MALYSVPEQEITVKKLDIVISQFIKSKGKIRPHFLLTGTTGTGKTVNIHTLAKHHKAQFIEVNAAQLTAEGISGNSLSKALKPLETMQNTPTIVFVDEADKLFTNGAGGSKVNSSMEVQNEFLKILESDSISVIGDYGKYNVINTSKVLYVFAGAFGGQENLNRDELKKMGVRVEFLGRIAAIFEMPTITLDSYIAVAKSHDLLEAYVHNNPNWFTPNKKKSITNKVVDLIHQRFDTNTLGLRMVSNLIHEVMIDTFLKES